MVIDGDDMDHLPRPNEDVYPAVSNWLIERSESRSIGMSSALTLYSCEMLTSPWWLTVTMLSSPSSMTIGWRSFFIELNLVRSLHIWWDAPASMTHAAGAEAAARAVGLSASQIRSRSGAVVHDAVPLLTLLHCSWARLKRMQSALKCPVRRQR